jgi:hypothetical protein
VTTSKRLLEALANGDDMVAWETAQTLASEVADNPLAVLARAVLEGGPFAMRKAEELAELLASSSTTKDAPRSTA